MTPETRSLVFQPYSRRQIWPCHFLSLKRCQGGEPKSINKTFSCTLGHVQHILTGKRATTSSCLSWWNHFLFRRQLHFFQMQNFYFSFWIELKVYQATLKYSRSKFDLNRIRLKNFIQPAKRYIPIFYEQIFDYSTIRGWKFFPSRSVNIKHFLTFLAAWILPRDRVPVSV